MARNANQQTYGYTDASTESMAIYAPDDPNNPANNPYPGVGNALQGSYDQKQAYSDAARNAAFSAAQVAQGGIDVAQQNYALTQQAAQRSWQAVNQGGAKAFAAAQGAAGTMGGARGASMRQTGLDVGLAQGQQSMALASQQAAAHSAVVQAQADSAGAAFDANTYAWGQIADQQAADQAAIQEAYQRITQIQREEGSPKMWMQRLRELADQYAGQPAVREWILNQGVKAFVRPGGL